METQEQKDTKIKAVKSIYEELAVGEDALAEVIRYHEMALCHARKLNTDSHGLDMLVSYADKLVRRNK